MENVYPAMDVVALSSRNEGTPLTLIEAMANARPVIATEVGGVVDLLGEPIISSGSQPAIDLDPKFTIRERGVSVAPDNPEAFAAGLERLIEDLTLRRETGARGLQFVTTQYSTDRLLKDIEQLYAGLLSSAEERSGGRPAFPTPS